MSYSQKSFDDLPVKEFLKQIESLSSVSISAQLDGVQFYFGLDSENKFYTSPYSADKRTKFFYKVSDYKSHVENNFYKAAHKALEQKQKEISSILKEGQAIECQIIASLDNSSFMGIKSNKIILVRPIKGEVVSPSKDQFNEIVSLFNSDVEVKVSMLDTMDGEKLFSQKTVSKWTIKKGKHVSGDQLFSSSDIEKILKKVKKFLNTENSIEIDDKTVSNFDIMTINLGSVPVLIRDKVKQEREKLNKELLVKYKLPIKNEILTSAEEHFKNRSLFISDGKNLISLLDDDQKSKNKFDTEFKRELDGFIKNLDPKASLEDKGGIIGNCQIRIATLLGIPELARFQSAQKIFKSYVASTPEEIAVNFANEGLGQMNFYGVKTKVISVLNYTIEEIQKLLDVFKQHVNSFEMIDSDGNKVTYTASQIKQNLLYFAQSKKQLSTLISDIKKAKQMSEIVLAIYSDPIHSVLGKSLRENLNEGVNPNLNTLSSMTTEEICDAYTATLLASLFLLRVQDKQSSRILKDSNVFTKLSNSMSPLNFWGHIVFKSYTPDVEQHLNSTTSKELKKIGGRVLMMRLNKVHKPISGNNNFTLDWHDMEQSCNLLVMRLSTRSQSINMIISGIRYWNDIILSDKITITNKLYFYLQRSVSNSPLLNRLRAVINLLNINASKENNLKKDSLQDVKENFLIFSKMIAEDEMNSTTSLSSISNNGYSGLSDMGDNGPNFKGNSSDLKNSSLNKPSSPEINNDNFKKDIRFMNGKPIVKRKRDFNKKKKFERNPEPKRISEDAEATATSSGDIATYPTRLFDKKKKKRIIKRIIPNSLTTENKINKLLKNSKFYKTIVSWNDQDYSGNFQTDEGVNYVKKTYGLSLTEITSEDRYPSVKIVGEYNKLVEFLINDYGASEEFIRDNLVEIGDF
jgi:hypothetical protein